jgi:hypothetical protein
MSHLIQLFVVFYFPIILFVLVSVKVECIDYFNILEWMLDICMHIIDLLNKAIKSDLGLWCDIRSWIIRCHPTNKSHIGCD